MADSAPPIPQQSPPAEAASWSEDILGPGFEALRLDLADGAQATLVAHRAAPPADGLLAGRAVLHIHGWSDYFFHIRLAEFWTGLGARFYALDLRDYGRNLRPDDPHQMPGFVDDLTTYDHDIAAALAAIDADPAEASAADSDPTPVKVILSGHSTGGLVEVLWADRHPDRVAGLVLNSPWLEYQYSTAARKLLTPFLGRPHTKRGTTPLPIRMPNYAALATSANLGRVPYDLALKPVGSFPVYGAWLRAIFEGHERVEDGLSITAPVLVQTSAASMRRIGYNPAMGSADIVLDVHAIAKRAEGIARTVVLDRIPGAVHDILLSAPEVQEVAYAGMRRFALGYLAD